MNRYPLWKNILVAIVVVLGLLYTLPNFFGESPAVQVSSVKAAVKLDAGLLSRVEDTLKAAGITEQGIFADRNSIRVRFSSTDDQLKAKDAIEHALNPDPADASYSVALNLLSSSPRWLTDINALPMYLGLDLRGGVHFLLQVDMKGAGTKRLDALAGDLRTTLRDKNVRHSGITRDGEAIAIRFRDDATRKQAENVMANEYGDLNVVEQGAGSDLSLVATLKPAARLKLQGDAIKQNITTLHNRINELGVAEPIIQQQGADRIVVQLPGVQDTAKAKDLIGRTATLEVRMVASDDAGSGEAAGADIVNEVGRDGTLKPIALKKQVVLTGDRFTSAEATFDQNHQPAVSVSLDAAGGRIMRDLTHDNIGKMMAIVLYEKGKGEAISVARIQGAFSNRFQITGRFSPEETSNLAILIRAGSLAAPMDIIEERTIGPTLGAENISKGFHSTLWGFTAIAAFMVLYYMLFGMVSVIALSVNLLFLIALLSLLQATLTLPGIAAIALTLGMAIDANVLINERVREELRNGNSPQAAITAGYERAWATILDSNVTTLIAGIALLIFGSGPVRGFAVVHCLGILTSIFSSVVVSRAVINLIYGRKKKLTSLSIGQIWKAQ